MTDLLFIELGAVVTETLGTNLCTIEPYCNTDYPPTYHSTKRVMVNLAESVDYLNPEYALEYAKYDQLQVEGNVGSGRLLGPIWPGGCYEGILRVRETLVQDNSILKAAAEELPGGEQRYNYQVIVSIADDGTVRRYHGFHVESVQNIGGAIKFRIKKKDAESVTDCHEITYSSDSQRFYHGAQVESHPVDNVISERFKNDQWGTSGAVFIDVYSSDADSSEFWALADEVPKLPPSAGL
jgi:hypothetical protein